MATYSLYVRTDDLPAVTRASRLLKLHENKSLAEVMVDICKYTVKKYDTKTDVEVE